MYRDMTLVFLTVLVSIICFSNVSAEVVKDGLVSHWTFDKADIDGKTVKDIVSGNDGEMVADPKTVEGKVGEALEFDGAGASMEVPHNDNLNFADGDFTVCIWAKTEAGTGRWAQRQDMIGKGDPSVSGYAISADTNKGFLWVGAEGEITGTTDINDNNWHYIVGLRSGSDCFVYTDGKQEGKGTNAESVDTANNIIFGKHPLKGESFFAGAIDEVCIYNRALTEDEILGNFGSEGEAISNLGKLSSTWGALRKIN